MNLIPVLADVIAGPFYALSAVAVVLVVALVVVAVVVTVGIIRKRRRK